MAVLNLRNIPDELMRKLKASAAERGQPFHAFVVEVLESRLSAFTPRQTAAIRRSEPVLMGGARSGGFESAEPLEEIEIT